MIRNTVPRKTEKKGRNTGVSCRSGLLKCWYGVICILVLAACTDPNRVYDKNYDLPDNLWLADSIAEFEFEIKDPTLSYDLYYNVRNSLSYPYHNLYVRHTLEDTLGNELANALQNMDLFDPITGKPLGDGLGDIFDHKILAISNKTFPEEGWYRFKIQQFMRQDSLPLILSIGLRVEINDGQSTD